MADYTNRFTEVNVILDKMDNTGHNGGESTEWVSMANYHRAFVEVITGALGGTLDVAIWQATNAAGAGAKVVAGKAITQLTAADDYDCCGIELQTEELDSAGGFDYIRVQTNSSAVNVFAIMVYGVVPRYPPGSTTGWDEVVT
jgi:hypothetical protein